MSSAETTNPNAPVSLIEQWDKTFAESLKVDHRKVTFQNRYGITLVGDLYIPKDRGERKLAAIAVSGPFGAVKEQSSGLYAQTLAEQGFVTLAFDPSYTGESGGHPRNVASPDINTEDFSAAVDFLGLQNEVDRNRIGLLGICGTSDMRDVHANIEKGDEKAALAFKMLTRSIKKVLGSYFFLLGNVDSIVFTAGIGENDEFVREAVCEGLEPFGIKVDKKENHTRKPGARVISTPDSRIPVLIIPTNEELEIATTTMRIVEESQK